VKTFTNAVVKPVQTVQSRECGYSVLSHINPPDSIQRYNKKDVSTYHSNGGKVRLLRNKSYSVSTWSLFI